MRAAVAVCISICLVPLVTMPLESASNPVPYRPDSFGDPSPAPNTSVIFASEFIDVTLLDIACVTAHYVFRNPQEKDITQTISLPFARSPQNLSLNVGDQNIQYSWGDLRYEYRDYRACRFDLAFSPLEEKDLVAVFYMDCEDRAFWNATSNESGSGYEFKYLATTGRSWGRPIERATFEFNVRKDACIVGESLGYWSGFELEQNVSWVVAKRELTDWTAESDIIFDWVVGWRHRPVVCADFVPCKVNRNDTFYFDLSGSYDEDGCITHYFVDFGDGKDSGWGRSPIIPHSYKSAGLYFPMAKVRDNTSLESEALQAGPVSVETGQDAVLDDDGYVLLEFTTGWQSKKYSLSPDEQMLDGCCDFDVDDGLKMVIARNRDQGYLEGVFSTPHASRDIDILDISDNASVLLSLKESFGTAQIRLGYLESWPSRNLTSSYDAARITNWGIWSKSLFRHWDPPVSIPDPRNSHGYDTSLLQTGDGLYRLVWDGEGGLWHSSSSDARIWSSPTLLPVASASTYPSDFGMIDDSNGTYWLVWAEYANSSQYKRDIWISSSRDFVNWSNPAPIPGSVINTPFDEHDPFLMQDEEGTFWLAFVSGRVDPAGVFLARSVDCRHWALVPFDGGWSGNGAWDESTSPSLFQDANDILWLVWDAKDTNRPYNRMLLYSKSQDGSKWSLPERFSVPACKPAKVFARMSQTNGTFWLVWRDELYPQFSRSKNAADWSAPVRLDHWSRSSFCTLTDLRGRQWLSYFGDGVMHVQEFPDIPDRTGTANWVHAEFADIIPPRILNVSIAPAIQLPGDPVTMDATGTDNKEIETMWINITGPKKFSPLEARMNRTGPSSFSYIGAFGIGGNYSVSIRARDAAGNEFASDTYAFTIVQESVGGQKDHAGGIGPSSWQAIGPGLIILAISTILVTVVVALRKRRGKTPG